MKGKLLNLLLRLSGLIVKSFAIIYLANILDTSEYEKYGLLFGAIPLMVILLGFDIYTNYQRNPEYLTRKYRLPKEQFSIYLFLYLIVLSSAIVQYILSKNTFYITLIFVGVLEHFYQELFRFYNYIGHFILASKFQLIKSTVWIIFLIISEYVFEYTITYLIIVIVYTSFTLAIIIQMVRKMPFRLGLKMASLKQVGNIVFKAGLLFFNAILWRFILAGDRYLVAYNFENYSAKYILSSQIALTLFLIYDAIFVSIEFPKLAKNFGNTQYQRYFAKAFLLLLLISGVIISFYPLKDIFSIEIQYLDDIWLFVFVVAFYFVISLNMLLDTAYILGKKEGYVLAINFTSIVGLVFLTMFTDSSLNKLLMNAFYLLFICASWKFLAKQKIIFSHI